MTPGEQALRERHVDIIRRLDEPRLGNPKHAMERRAIEGELRALTARALALLDAARADAERLAEVLFEVRQHVPVPRSVTVGPEWMHRRDQRKRDAVAAADDALAAHRGEPQP